MAQQHTEQCREQYIEPAKEYQERDTTLSEVAYASEDAERFEALKAEMEQHGQRMARRARQMSNLMIGYSGFMALYGLLIVLFYMPNHIAPSIVFTVSVAFLPLLLLFSPWLDMKGIQRSAKEAVSINDLRVVGLLIDMLLMSETKQPAMNALTRMLPRLQASDAALVSKSQRERLCRELSHNGRREWFGQRHERFAVAILKAFEQIGDADALPVVQALAAANYDAVPAIVRSAARECLPALEARCADQQSRDTLLRPSEVAATGQNVLVRPAETSASEAPKQLLRPSASQRGVEERHR
jgi:hypothetical protein